MKLVITLTLLLSASLSAATYYVDYDTGSDSNAGTSTGAPWKHVPDDPAASGTADTTVLAAGDTVNLKGGVRYKGNFTVFDSGSSGNLITFEGSSDVHGWGTGMAILDPSTTISGTWTQVASQEDAMGNVGWTNIYYISTALSSFQTGIYEDSVLLNVSCEPTPEDPFLWESVTAFGYPISIGNQTTTTITDTTNLTQSDSNYWAGAYASIWVTGNGVQTRAITAFDTSTDTITHDAVSGVYGDRTTYYSIVNHLASMVAGTYVLDEGTGTLYVWAHDSANPSTHTYTTTAASNVAAMSNESYWKLHGFVITGGKIGVYNSGGGNFTVEGNELRGLVDSNSTSTPVYLLNTTGATISSNVVTQARNRGIQAINSLNLTVRSNALSLIDATGIYAAAGTNILIHHNSVLGVSSIHANGISVYTGSAGGNCDTVLIAHNICSGFNASNFSFTTEASQSDEDFSNICYFGNVATTGVAEWGYGTDGAVYANNTFAAAVLVDDASTSVTWRNNIIGGYQYCGRNYGTYPWTKSHNAYMGDPDASNELTYLVNTTYGWAWGTGELYVDAGGGDYDGIGTAALFASYPSDLTLAASSDAVNGGTSPASDLPTSDWPTYDFTVDVLGNAFAGDGTWDIGAYEYIPPASPTFNVGTFIVK